jgi:hypothetical protein
MPKRSRNQKRRRSRTMRGGFEFGDLWTSVKKGAQAAVDTVQDTTRGAYASVTGPQTPATVQPAQYNPAQYNPPPAPLTAAAPVSTSVITRETYPPMGGRRRSRKMHRDGKKKTRKFRIMKKNRTKNYKRKHKNVVARGGRDPYVIRKNTVANSLCPICQQTLLEDISKYKASCGHFFHKNCLLSFCERQVENQFCPLCSNPLQPDCNSITSIQ